MNKFFALALAGSAMLTAGSVEAATLNITGISNVYNTYTADITKTVSPKVDYENVSISPQQITGKLDGQNVSLFAYCVDIYQFSGVGSFDVVSLSSYLTGLGLGSKYNALAAIISANSTKSNAATDSAVQLAIWETLYETNSTKDLGTGKFTATGITDGNYWTNDSIVDTKADSIVNAAVNGAINPNITFYVAKNSAKQDLLFWTVATPAIPEPATWGMMLLGMGIVGYSMRRRKVDVSFA